MKRAGIVMAAVCLGVAASEVRPETRVWTSVETRRVLREDRPPEAAPTGAALALARNETRSFQVLMRGDQPIKAVRIEPADLIGPGGTALRADDAVLYRQHQFQITRGTYRNAEFKEGWYPDALIPFRHPVSGAALAGGRFAAALDLPAGQTHGFWVDIHVPEDVRPGEYKGVYRVVGGSGHIAQVPVSVRVWDFTLPRVSTFVTAFGSPAGRMRAYYRKRAQTGIEPEPKDWAAVETQCAKMLTEHRINATPPADVITPRAQPDGSYRITDEQVAALRRFVDAYHVNAIQAPHPRAVVKDPAAEKQKLAAWLAAFDRAAAALERPGIVFYTYLLDEPNDLEAYRYVQTWGKAIRDARSVVKVMVVEQTKTQNEAWGDLYGAVDIWCPLFPLFDPASAARRQALGETLWCYTALCQGKQKTPWWQTDYPLLHYRVPGWMAWRYGMRGILYWGGLSYWDKVADPWTEPNTYQPTDSPNIAFNGDGSIVYPARAVGYDGIAPSLRLKALRDMVQDYEYLALAERVGRRAEAQRIVLDLTPSFFEWKAEPGAYDAAREELARLIMSRGPAR